MSGRTRDKLKCVVALFLALVVVPALAGLITHLGGLSADTGVLVGLFLGMMGGIPAGIYCAETWPL